MAGLGVEGVASEISDRFLSSADGVQPAVAS